MSRAKHEENGDRSKNEKNNRARASVWGQNVTEMGTGQIRKHITGQTYNII